MDTKDITGVGDLPSILPPTRHSDLVKCGEDGVEVTECVSDPVVGPVLIARGTEGLRGYGVLTAEQSKKVHGGSVTRFRIVDVK